LQHYLPGTDVVEIERAGQFVARRGKSDPPQDPRTRNETSAAYARLVVENALHARAATPATAFST
jgi:hypothetical protein